MTPMAIMMTFLRDSFSEPDRYWLGWGMLQFVTFGLTPA